MVKVLPNFGGCEYVVELLYIDQDKTSLIPLDLEFWCSKLSPFGYMALGILNRLLCTWQSVFGKELDFSVPI
jgi:hypothetical protein